jgi:hypothetical protein
MLGLASPVSARPAVYDLTAWGGDDNRVVLQQSPPGCHPGPDFDDAVPCVVNPYAATNTCYWDHADMGNGAGYGRLLAGTYSVSRCAIFDARIADIGVGLLTTRPDLTVTLAFEPGLTFSLAPVPYDDPEWTWSYRGCIVGPIYQRTTSPFVADIVGSDADGLMGWGVLTTVTLTVSSPVSQKANETTSGGAVHLVSSDAYCYGGGSASQGQAISGPGLGSYRVKLAPGSTWAD